MKRKQPNDLFWAVLGILNLLAVCYPLNLWLEADDELGRLVAIVALIGAGLLLAILDMVTIVFVYTR